MTDGQKELIVLVNIIEYMEDKVGKIYTANIGNIGENWLTRDIRHHLLELLRQVSKTKDVIQEELANY